MQVPAEFECEVAGSVDEAISLSPGWTLLARGVGPWCCCWETSRA